MLVDQLDHLTPAELILLEEHLKLGVSHIKHHLTDREFDKLLAAGSVDKERLNKLENTETELSGNLSLILNTIFTATFGAWLGYSSFLEFSISSFWVFISIVLLAALIGSFIGYESVKSTKQQARGSIQLQKLHFLQLQILKKVHQKRTAEIDKIISDLNTLFPPFSFSGLTGKPKEELAEWASKLEKMLEDKLRLNKNTPLYATCAGELAEVQSEFKRALIDWFEKKGELGVIHSKFQEQKEEKLDSSLRKLINVSPKHSSEPPSWIKTNARSLVVGLAPTLLGGFSSISVYLGGVPLILKTFGYDNLFLFFSDPTVKMVEISISLLITLYFGFSFVYINRKAFKRYQELVKTDKTIIQNESSLTVLDAQMLKLKELKSSAVHLVKVFNLISHLRN
jgi:hypothetical protein